MIKGSERPVDKSIWNKSVPKKIIVQDDTGTDSFRKMLKVREQVRKMESKGKQLGLWFESHQPSTTFIYLISIDCYNNWMSLTLIQTIRCKNVYHYQKLRWM